MEGKKIMEFAFQFHIRIVHTIGFIFEHSRIRIGVVGL